ncbi:MAG: glycosyltransferase family 9 protein [Verrucomicrobia bacterium]|nr:glycosyltransferase family 9 protein [Verrucomicrobiota bacterium]
MIIRPDNIGDCILFSGAFAHIRKRWPAARIELIVQSHVRALFEHCPHVDRVRSLDCIQPWEAVRRKVQKGSWALQRVLLRPALRRCWYPKADVVIYPVSAPTEDMLAAVRLIDAPVKMGYAGEQLRIQKLEDEANAPEHVFTKTFENTAENRWMHEQERGLKFLHTMNIPAEAMDPELWLSEEDHAVAARLLCRAGGLGLFVGAGHRLRQWPVEKWVALVRTQNVADRVVVLGQASDASYATAIAEAVAARGQTCVDLTGKTTLRQLAAVVQRCGAVVSNDSSGLHMAVASGVPAVGLMGGYHYGRYYPWGNPAIHRVARVEMDCYHCNDACRYGDWRCVSDIDVEHANHELELALAGASH